MRFPFIWVGYLVKYYMKSQGVSLKENLNTTFQKCVKISVPGYGWRFLIEVDIWQSFSLVIYREILLTSYFTYLKLSWSKTAPLIAHLDIFSIDIGIIFLSKGLNYFCLSNVLFLFAKYDTKHHIYVYMCIHTYTCANIYTFAKLKNIWARLC